MPLFFYQKQKTNQTGWKGKMEQNETREEEIKQAVRMANQLERTRVLELLDKAELEKWFDMPDTTENWKTWKKIRNTINREDK